jgi:hypothetical protein
MARTPIVPRRPAGRPRVVPPVVPDPVVDLPPVDENPPVIDDEFRVAGGPGDSVQRPSF